MQSNKKINVYIDCTFDTYMWIMLTNISVEINAEIHCVTVHPLYDGKDNSKKLSRCRETTRCFVSLNISLTHSRSLRSFEMTRAVTVPLFPFPVRFWSFLAINRGIGFSRFRFFHTIMSTSLHITFFEKDQTYYFALKHTPDGRHCYVCL